MTEKKMVRVIIGDELDLGRDEGQDGNESKLTHRLVFQFLC